MTRRLMFAPGKAPELQERVCRCHFSRKSATVRVRLDRRRGRAHFIGLETCGSVWLCPVCAGNVTDERRAELQRAAARWKEQGGEIYLLTLTFPHARRDDLRRLVLLMRKSADLFNTSRQVGNARKAAGYVGAVRAFEITWGIWHGWHPHFHLLYFCQPGQLATLKKLETVWVDALITSGLADSSQRNDMLHGAGGESPAFDVQNGDYASDYIAKFGHEPSWASRIEAGHKWSAAAELVNGMAKVGRRLTGLTPFTLLAVVAGLCKVPFVHPGRAAVLFSEFAYAFKNQRQLYWSRGLWDRLNMGQLWSDDELASLEHRAPNLTDVCELAPPEWRLVLQHRAQDEVLRAAESAGARGVFALLAELRGRAPPGVPSRSLSEFTPEGSYVEGLDAPRMPSVRPGFVVLGDGRKVWA